MTGQPLTPAQHEARREFWEHEVGHVDVANETAGQATEAEVQARYPIGLVLAETQPKPTVAAEQAERGATTQEQLNVLQAEISNRGIPVRLTERQLRALLEYRGALRASTVANQILRKVQLRGWADRIAEAVNAVKGVAVAEAKPPQPAVGGPVAGGPRLKPATELIGRTAVQDQPERQVGQLAPTDRPSPGYRRFLADDMLDQIANLLERAGLGFLLETSIAYTRTQLDTRRHLVYLARGVIRVNPRQDRRELQQEALIPDFQESQIADVLPQALVDVYPQDLLALIQRTPLPAGPVRTTPACARPGGARSASGPGAFT